MERVALARLVNDEIRALAGRLESPGEEHAFAWMCACGCFTIATATTRDYDAAGGRVFVAGHPINDERAAATETFERDPDAFTVARRVDERKRRELTAELARRLERQVMANHGTT
jgi:hypothetical protein